MAITFNPYVMRPPGPRFEDSDTSKVEWFKIFQNSADLNDYPERHEMLGIQIKFNEDLKQGHGFAMKVTFKNRGTGEVLFSDDRPFPEPGPNQIYKDANFFWWIGHADHEINRAMQIQVESQIFKSNVSVASNSLLINVAGPEGEPSDEPPANIIDLIKNILVDVFINAMTLQDALVKWKLLPQFVGDFLNNVLDLFSVNIAPEGEAPVRVILPGAAGIIAKIPKVTSAAATKLSSEILEAGASKTLALATKNPAGVKAALLSLSESSISKLFGALSETATGRIALVRLMTILKDGSIDKAATAFGVRGFLAKAPKAILGFFALLWVLKFVGFDLPGYVAIFRKEIPEPASMAVWATIESAQTAKTETAWLAARDANAKFLKFIDLADKETAGIVRLNPWLADIYSSSSDAQRAQHEGFMAVIDSALAQFPDVPPEQPVPPTDPDQPPETQPGEETPDPVNVPTPGKSFITVDSNPRGAQIWIDGKNTFTVTPFAHSLDSGKHNIQLQLFRYLPTFESVDLEAGKSIIKTYNIKLLEPTVPESPFIPVPIDVPLEKPAPVTVKPNAWEYTITARDADTGQILNAKIIIDGIFTGKYTTNSVILEPEATFLLRLEAFGYTPGELLITTETLPS